MDNEKRRDELYQLLGDLPSRQAPISSKKVKEELVSNYVLETWTLDLNRSDPVPAYFAYPREVEGPFPTILYNHSHGGDYHIGKEELIKGKTSLQQPAYAEELTQMGYAVLSIDAWGFGSRKGRTEDELFKEMLWSGQVLWGNMVYDSLRAVDYLITRPDVDKNRLGTMGLSMGSVMSWWLSALDTRIKVCVDICGLVDFESLVEDRAFSGHGLYFFVPDLLNHFATSSINALIAPRPHLSLAGNYDRLVPSQGLDKIDQQLKMIYSEKGKPDAWKLLRYNIGHFETADMRYEIKEFLKKWL